MSKTPIPGLVYVVTAKRTSQGFKEGTRIVWDDGVIDELTDYTTGCDVPAAAFTSVDGKESWWVAWQVEARLEITPPNINDINDIEQFLKEG